MASSALGTLGWLSRVAAIVLGTLGLAPAQTADADEARRVQVVDLQGTPYERGLAHGRALKDQIAQLVPLFQRDIAERGGGTAAEFLEWFLASTSYDDAIRRHCPELLDEVRGLAVGAGQDFETMFAYQLIDEYWVQSMLREAHKCTTIGIAATADQPTIVAQNIDIPQWMHAWPTVLRIRASDSDLASLVVTIPGVIGAMGLNSGRVAVGVNTILQIAPCRDGLPVAFVVRGLLQQPDVAAARAFAKEVRHASGQAYTIGGPDDVTCFECSANAVVPFVPASGPQRVWHTNHPEASTDFAPMFVRWAKATGGVEPADFDHACSRFSAVAAALTAGEPCGPETAMALLSDPQHQVCNPSTYTCVVMTLGEEPVLRLSAGAPNVAEFRTVRLPR